MKATSNIAAAYKKTGVPFFVMYQNVAGDMSEYTSVLPIMKFAEMDSPSPLIKTFGEEVFANLVRDLSRCTTSQVRYFSLPMDDLTINKGPLGELWMLTRTSLNPGKFPEYQAWLKTDYKPALEKAGVTQFRASRPIFGLPGGQIHTIRMMKNFAEIDAGPILTQKLGADATRALNAKTNGLVRAVTTSMIRVRPDLSYQPAPAAGSN